MFRKDLTGQPFHRLTVVSYAYTKDKKAYWLCQCSCPAQTQIFVDTSSLIGKNTKSCGCYMRDRIRATQTKHGHNPHGKPSRTYRAWQMMLRRCASTHPQHADYHDRGITVFVAWHDFRQFLADMGECPPGMTLDRKNNDQGYTKDNCRWATRRQQANNRRNTPMFTHNGTTKSLSYWAEEYCISYKLLHARIYTRHMTLAEALSTPIRRRTRHT